MTELLTISEVRRRTQNGFVTARVHAQVESTAARATREGKPYCEISLADACDRMILRVWDNHPDYKSCSALQDGDFIEIDGEFAQHQQFGLEARTWKSRSLTSDEIANLLAGPPELRAKQSGDSAFIIQAVTAISDPRLRGICELFLKDFGERFRRTAAARNYHHARRGGLVDDTWPLMRVALALCPLYPQLNLDLLLAGILFHDSGKLWENHLPEDGFTMGFDERGERSEEHTSELQSHHDLVCRLLLEKKKIK